MSAQQRSNEPTDHSSATVPEPFTTAWPDNRRNHHRHAGTPAVGRSLEIVDAAPLTCVGA
ncbi:hypothetical protein FRACA_2590001 [Frankia canadensis]|uniref:Uncharacterized protein n=1 Tax=Frankia canadensis TaxID=1836972 RepID=A0A2I2KSB1_9ACTN|nr:hypothetical protein FRACA_2590001 [Frankia canadensis]SOU55832.1 hypothetical protein FRACA_2590001 [Frankia canadensis]